MIFLQASFSLSLCVSVACYAFGKQAFNLKNVCLLHPQQDRTIWTPKNAALKAVRNLNYSYLHSPSSFCSSVMETSIVQ